MERNVATRLLLLTPAELTRDTRARRAAVAARMFGYDVVGLCGRISGEAPAPLEGVTVVRVGREGRTHAQWKLGEDVRREPAAVRELRGLFRLIRYAARTATLVRGGRTLGRFDVVHANDLDTLAAGYVLARRSGASLVYDAHELYSEFEPTPPRLARALLLRLERTLARRADAVVTVSDAIADELRNRFRVEPVVVLNAPPLDPREAPEPAREPLRLVYQGAFGPGRPLAHLVAAIREAPNVRLTLRVSRMSAAEVRATVPDDLATRVDAADAVPPGEVVDALHGHHIGLVFDRPSTRNAELSSPNKLFEYLMAGLAVVAPRLPGLAWIEEQRVGLCFDPGSPSAMAAAFERLDEDRALLGEVRANARAAAVERYNAEAQRQALARAWGLDASS